MTTSWAQMATATATILRNPAPVGGKVGSPVTHLTGLAVVPPLPVTAEIAAAFDISSPREAKVTYVDDLSADIAEGDQMIVGGVTYRVQGVGEYDGALDVLEIVLSLVK